MKGPKQSTQVWDSAAATAAAGHVSVGCIVGRVTSDTAHAAYDHLTGGSSSSSTEKAKSRIGATPERDVGVDLSKYKRQVEKIIDIFYIRDDAYENGKLNDAQSEH